MRGTNTEANKRNAAIREQHVRRLHLRLLTLLPMVVAKDVPLPLRVTG